MSGSTAEREAAEGRPDGPTPTEVCPHFHAAIELIGKRWSGAIIWALSQGPLRYADLKRVVPGLSDRLLSQRLRELEEAGLMERTVEDGFPVRVSYGLTEKGEALKPSIQGLQEWACEWRDGQAG